VRVLPVSRLDFIEARDDAVMVRSEGKSYRMTQTLSSLADSLDPARFLRVHRSYVLNVDRLRRVELYSKNSHIAILADGARIPLSREGHAKLRELLGADAKS
jgi:two-component system LytT family response regulator